MILPNYVAKVPQIEVFSNGKGLPFFNLLQKPLMGINRLSGLGMSGAPPQRGVTLFLLGDILNRINSTTAEPQLLFMVRIMEPPECGHSEI